MNTNSKNMNILAMSAVDQNTLLELVNEYDVFFKNKEYVNLADVCYTANTGRGHYNYRLAFVFENRFDLIEKIKMIKESDLESKTDVGIYYGYTEKLKGRKLDNIDNGGIHNIIKTSTSCGEAVNKMAELYIKGETLNWDELYEDEKRWRVSVPVYPFAKIKCWAFNEEEFGQQYESENILNENVHQESYNGMNNCTKQLERELSLPNFKLNYLYNKKDVFKKEEIEIEFSKSFCGRLIVASKENFQELYILLLAGIEFLLYKYSGKEDIIVFIPSNFEGERRLINPIVPIRTKFENCRTFSDFLTVTRENYIKANENKQGSEKNIGDFPGVEYQNSRPVLNTIVTLNELHKSGQIEDVMFNTAFHFFYESNTLKVNIEYNGVFIEKTFIKGIVKHLENFFEVILSCYDIDLKAIDIINSKEKLQLKNGAGISELKIQDVYDLSNVQVSQFIKKPYSDMDSSDIKLYLANNNGFCPVGVAGEIYISSISIDKIADKDFDGITDDSLVKGITLYKTGHLGMWTEDGNMSYIGPQSQQVDVKGHCFNLRRIEVILKKYTGIKDVAVIDIEKEFCVYLVCGDRLEEKEVKLFLEKYIPEYMMPKYFMFVEKIVRTLDGEVDTGFLPDPLAIIHENSGKILPKSKIEKRLAEAWQRVLGIREFDVDDHFFELGGNSMKAVQIAAYLKKYNYIMEYKDLIKYPTIEKLSKHISVAG